MIPGGVDTGMRGKGKDFRIVYHCCKLLPTGPVTLADASFEQAVTFLADCTAVTVETPNATAGMYSGDGTKPYQARLMQTVRAAARIAAHLTARGKTVYELSAQSIRKAVGCKIITRGPNKQDADKTILAWLWNTELRLHRGWPAERIAAALHSGRKARPFIPQGELGTEHLRDAYLACICAERMQTNRLSKVQEAK